MWSRVFVLTAVLIIPTLALAQERAKKPKSFVVELVDVDGNPVEGANVGILASLGVKRPGQTTEWNYNSPTRSDATGSARVSEENEGMLKHHCLVARHEERKIAAVTSLDPANLSEPVKLTLVSECLVTTDANCSELAERWIPGELVQVRHAGKRMLVAVCKDAKICLPLPPGNYEFDVAGEMTCHLKRSVQVVAAKSQQLDTFDLPASNLGLLHGKRAPEFPDVVGWKNGPGPKLADLRGKCVVLDFFGYWCPGCLEQMPELMALYDKHRDRGLVVICVHVDLDDQEEPVDTVERLDKRLAAARANAWQGRDLPFPVALIKSVRTKYRDDVPGLDESARSRTSSIYGVMGYPTQILIDRQGNVVGEINLHAEGIKLLEKTLQDK